MTYLPAPAPRRLGPRRPRRGEGGRDGSPQDPARPGAEHLLPHLPRPAVCTSDSVVAYETRVENVRESSGPGTGRMLRKCPSTALTPALPCLSFLGAPTQKRPSGQFQHVPPTDSRHNERGPSATGGMCVPWFAAIVLFNPRDKRARHVLWCPFYRGSS